MVRGGPVRRTRDVRVRLTPAEHATWSAARERSGRRELGAWVRAVVNELVDQADDEPAPAGRARQLLDAAAYAALVRTASNVNQLARWANTAGRYPAEAQAAAAYRDVRDLVAQLRAALATTAAAGRRRRGRR